MLTGKGSLLGEEDVISRKTYSCTVKCYSLEGTAFVLDKDHFL
jgi:CRP-like cAMP-binding protein